MLLGVLTLAWWGAWALAEGSDYSQQGNDAHQKLRDSTHTNNWAVLVSTSRFWFNYRHMANVLSFYRTVKRLGIPDDQIIMMLSDDVACDPRNAFPGAVFNMHEHNLDLYGENIEVDFRGYEVTVENFIRLLTDRWDSDMPKSKRLDTDSNSNIFVYLTGHGGDDFLKFQDAEEIQAWDIADAFGQMWEKRRYNEILFMIDTCEANTMHSKIFSPNILAVGSSQIHESSYANDTDREIGVALIDRFTSSNLEYLETNVEKASNLTLADLFGSYDVGRIASRPGIRTDLFPHKLDTVRITDFFGNVPTIEVDAGVNEFKNDREASWSNIQQWVAPEEDIPRATETPKHKPSPRLSCIVGLFVMLLLILASKF